ncbi:hypothetical protein [Sulfurovum sp. NBC37-1]|uniref:hypothetical protein n=1 Tax=Sulfurovum sp. (strain NBC37-1) TaxID=387093 RepID=UPI00015874D1|nr:hypothetical protein [Sulfurovum sp. NBC37-1]BAF71777.1 hypothetical protein SUN_0819 [Sulfurovum sp. NBC37-1]
MTEEKFKINLQKLKDKIARKPSKYTSDYASTFTESFNKYTRTSKVNFIASLNDVLIKFEWPYPVYMEGDRSNYAIIKEIIVGIPIYFKLNILHRKQTAEFAEKFINIYMLEIFIGVEEKYFQVGKKILFLLIDTMLLTIFIIIIQKVTGTHVWFPLFHYWIFYVENT